MKVLVTDIIAGVSGLPNQFTILPISDPRGNFMGLNVHVAGDYQDEDLKYQSLIRLLEIQVDVYLEKMRMLAQMSRLGETPELKELQIEVAESTLAALEYTHMLRDRVNLTFITQ